MSELQPGDSAPAFDLKDQEGRDVSLEDFRGRKVLVYFYPKADTPGCTAQACAVRDAKEDLSGLGVEVVGISPDRPDAQEAFDLKYGLSFPLLSDSDHAVADAYGTWGERTFAGKTFMGLIRSSFLVDEDGRIQEAWYAVKPKETVPRALEALGVAPATG